MVAAELAQHASIEAAAQSVVDRVKRLHHDVYVSGRQRAVYCSRHEDMTLLIRTINYPLADGALTPTQGTQQTHSYPGMMWRPAAETQQTRELQNSTHNLSKNPTEPTSCCLVNEQMLSSFLSSIRRPYLPGFSALLQQPKHQQNQCDPLAGHAFPEYSHQRNQHGLHAGGGHPHPWVS